MLIVSDGGISCGQAQEMPFGRSGRVRGDGEVVNVMPMVARLTVVEIFRVPLACAVGGSALPLIRNLKSRVLGERPLTDIECKETFRPEMHRGGDVEDIERAMATLGRGLTG